MSDKSTYSLLVGEWRVEIRKDGEGWRVDNGNIFLTSWATVLCPTFEKVLETLVLISKGKPARAPEGCFIKPYTEDK